MDSTHITSIRRQTIQKRDREEKKNRCKNTKYKIYIKINVLGYNINVSYVCIYVISI